MKSTKKLPAACLLLFGLLISCLSIPQPVEANQTAPVSKTSTWAKAGVVKERTIAYYYCPMCHDKYTIAEAKKVHFICTCCNQKLVAVTVASAK